MSLQKIEKYRHYNVKVYTVKCFESCLTDTLGQRVLYKKPRRCKSERNLKFLKPPLESRLQPKSTLRYYARNSDFNEFHIFLWLLHKVCFYSEILTQN